MELVSACQSCGIENIQLALLPLVHDSQWSECEQILEESGIHVLSGMLEADGEDYSTLKTIEQTGGVRQDAMWSSTLENANRVADIAASMGLPMVTFHAGFIPELECSERTTMLRRIRTLTDVFDKRGVLLGLETGQEKAENVVSVLEELSMPTLGVNFDPANMILYGKGDPIEAIQLLKPWVMQVHIKDAKVTEEIGTWGTETPVGNGDVPWEEFLDIVPDNVHLVIEREGGENRIEDIQSAKALLHRLDAC
jgi:sugar phosphate isomerase/epimerase